MSTLSHIVALPLLAAIALTFVPRTFRVVMRGVTLGVTFVSALLALKMFLQFKAGVAGYQFEYQIPWVESLGISAICRLLSTSKTRPSISFMRNNRKGSAFKSEMSFSLLMNYSPGI